MIEKNGKQYTINEYDKKWVIKRVEGQLTIKYELSKTDYSTYDEVKNFIETSDTF